MGLKAEGNLSDYATGDSSGKLLVMTNSQTLSCDISAQNSNHYIGNGFNQSKGFIY